MIDIIGLFFTLLMVSVIGIGFCNTVIKIMETNTN